MAKQINIASVRFDKEELRGEPGAAGKVLEDTQRCLNELKGYGLDLVVLSEGIEAVGMTNDTAESVDQPGAFLSLYQSFATEEGCHVAGSVRICRRGDAIYNAIAFVDRRGTILDTYHKVNLTQGEIDDGLKSGTGAVVVDTDIGRLGGAICFDLNFEGIRHEYRALKPDILAFASMYHGGLMQQVWAYECQAFFVSALQFNGGGILDPFGRPLKLTDCYSAAARATINLDRAMVHLDYNREKFAAIEKKYRGRILIDTPPNIGSALIYSVCDELTALEVVNEYELQLVEDYFAASLDANAANR